MDITSLLDISGWFGKKKKNAADQQSPAPAARGKSTAAGETPADQNAASLAGVSLYVMPKAANGEGKAMTAGSAASSSPDGTKQMGIIIISVGGVILVAAAALLVWYIFFTGPAAPVADVPADTAPVSTNTEPATPATTTENADDVADDSDSDDATEVACGTAVWYGPSGDAGTASTTSLGDASGWACFGERLRDDCRPARVTVETVAGTMTEMTVSGAADGACEITAQFPDRVDIVDSELVPYADTMLQCPYAAARVADDDSALAKAAYAMLWPLTVTADTSCTGSALTVWEEQRAVTDDDQIPATLEPGADSDNDGLTDVEEQTVYVTASDTADTDNDGYDDGVEVRNGYNPAGSGTLEESGLLATENNGSYGYSFRYPAAWDVQTQGGGATVLVTAPTGGFIQIVVHENEAGESLAQWYQDTTGASTAPASARTQNGLTYLTSEDGLTAYGAFTNEANTILVVTYSPTTGRIEYQATFDMLIASLTR